MTTEKNPPKRNQYTERNLYSVYWKKTGQPLIIGGTSDECMREMDLTSMSSFWAIWNKIKNNHPKASQKWIIERYVGGRK